MVTPYMGHNQAGQVINHIEVPMNIPRNPLCGQFPTINGYEWNYGHQYGKTAKTLSLKKWLDHQFITDIDMLDIASC